MTQDEYNQAVRERVAEGLAQEDGRTWYAMTPAARASYLKAADELIASVAREPDAAEIICAAAQQSGGDER